MKSDEALDLMTWVFAMVDAAGGQIQIPAESLRNAVQTPMTLQDLKQPDGSVVLRIVERFN